MPFTAESLTRKHKMSIENYFDLPDFYRFNILISLIKILLLDYLIFMYLFKNKLKGSAKHKCCAQNTRPLHMMCHSSCALKVIYLG